MSQYGLENFGAYRKAKELFDHERLKHWLQPEIIQHRTGLADEIIAILTKTIGTLQNEIRQSSSKANYLKDEPLIDETDGCFPPLDARHSTLDTPPS